MTAASCTAGNQPATGHNSSSGRSSSGDSGKYLTYFPCCSWNTTWSYNLYNANGLTIQNDFITMRLAIRKTPSLTEYEPQLADSWIVSNGKPAIKLHPGARWQDNKPVTNKDVYDPAILDATNAAGFWNDITNITTPDDSTVVFTLKKGQSVPLALNDLLPNLIAYPSQVYGKFVTPQLTKAVFAWAKDNQENPTEAQKTSDFQLMSNTFKELAALNVPTLIGDGPFKLDDITNSQAKLSKWNGFWGADKIRIGGINNSHQCPLNITAVRQALAYVIPRKQMNAAAFGNIKGSEGAWKEINTGISPAQEELSLTPAQLAKLNKYPVDPAKATQLLESKGFTKQGNQWMMPNGKAFKLTLTVSADTSLIVTAFSSAAKALTAFGIKADVNATSGAQRIGQGHRQSASMLSEQRTPLSGARVNKAHHATISLMGSRSRDKRAA